MEAISLGGYRYVSNFLDNYTWFVGAYFMK